MAKSKYIKVELKDKSKHVVLAANEAFYKNQGAKVSEPTQKEIEDAFPEAGAKSKDLKDGKDDKGDIALLNDRIIGLEVENEGLKAENKTLLEQNETLKAEKEALKSVEPEKDKK